MPTFPRHCLFGWSDYKQKDGDVNVGWHILEAEQLSIWGFQSLGDHAKTRDSYWGWARPTYDRSVKVFPLVFSER
jgi:hypothetical protein